MTRFLAVFTATILAAFAFAGPAQAGTGTINVTPQSTGNAGINSDFIILTLTAPDGSLTSTIGFRGSVTSFTGLEAGTYEILARDLGGVIDDPREGSATVTIGEGETADVTINLISVGFPFPGPILF